jgi:integrase
LTTTESDGHESWGFPIPKSPQRRALYYDATLRTTCIGLDASIGLDANRFGTHSLRRTKATLIYRRTGNLRAVQLLLGHRKIESTVRYLGIEVDDALAIAEQVDV